MQEMCDLSSRAEVSRTSASFTYNYGDFPVDPIEVLTQYFDALFYTASWGSRRLAFRFPISGINYEAFRRFGGNIRGSQVCSEGLKMRNCLRNWR